MPIVDGHRFGSDSALKWEGQQESLGVPAGDVWPSLNKGVPTA